MTDTPTGIGDLVKRLRDGINPDEGAFDREPPTWARDPFNEDMADRCGRCGSWRELVRPGKTQCTYCWDDDTRAMRLEAADALEAAERVIAPFAEVADKMEKCKDHRPLWAALDSGWSHRSDRPTVGDLRALRDWPARQAIGQEGGDDDR